MMHARFVRFAICAILAFSSAGCGKYDRIDNGGFTKVSFTGIPKQNPALASTLSSGILIYAFSTSYVTNLKITDEIAPASITLPNGAYSFYAFGYTSAPETGGGDIRCAVAGAGNTIALTGAAVSVPLSFKQSNCSDAGFAPTSNFLDNNISGSTLPNYGPIFPQMDFVHCGSAAGLGLTAIASTQDCSTNAGTGISAPWNSVAKYQVVIPIFSGASGGTFTKLGEAYRTPCSSSYPSAGGQASFSSYTRFPVGNASSGIGFPIAIESFSDAACTSAPIGVHTFKKGLNAALVDMPSYLGTVQAYTGSPNRLRVFLRQP